MPNESKEDKSYVDGLPVKISEKYKRPARIKLPLVCQNCTVNASTIDEYDFRLERTVLSKMEEWKKARAEQSHYREERRKRLEELDIAEKSKEQPSACNNAQEDNPSCDIASQPDILTPITAGNPSDSTIKPLPSYFNYSEFESDNSSPFDNMELKTINDMEALASVLSSTNGASNQEKEPSLINNNFIPNKNSVVSNNWDGYNNYSSPQYYEQTYSYPALYSPAMYSQPPHHQWPPRESLATQLPPYYGSTSSSAHQYSMDTGGIPGEIEDSRCNLVNQRSNSKSVPDLVNELERELKEKKLFDEQRRKTKTPPPPRSLLVNGSGLENWKPWPDLESPHTSGPDAIDTLSSPEQLLATHISEMGFPMPRVVRSLKKFQGEDKRVIDFLLQVQRLEEESYPGDLAERALHANNYDPAMTRKHLKGALTLLDLGFDVEAIERALIDSENDRDAALERLIS